MNSLKQSPILRIGGTIIATIALATTVAAPAAGLSSHEEVPALTSPSAESARVADDLTELSEQVSRSRIALFDVRTAEASGTQDRIASFPLPEGCTAAEEPGTLTCAEGQYTAFPAVLTLNGELVDYATSMTDDRIEVTASGDAEVFALYLAGEGGKEEAAEAPATLASMLAEEARPAAGVIDEGENPPLDEDDEPTGEWEEGQQHEGEAPSSELGDSYAPGTNEFLYPTAPALDAVTPLGAYKRPNSFISVPSNYVYCVIWTAAKCKPKSLHDYCTFSPDSFKYKTKLAWSEVSFRGPCARHDLAIDSIRKKSISLDSKKAQRRNADTKFKSQLRQNCGYKLYTSTPVRTACFGQAAIYYNAVSFKTSNWDGK